MLPKRYRAGKGEISSAITKGKTVHGTLLSLRVQKKNDTLPARAAVVVSSKVAETAVVRHRLKRQIRAILSKYLKGAPLSMVLVIFVKKEAVSTSYFALEKEIETLFADLR